VMIAATSLNVKKWREPIWTFFIYLSLYCLCEFQWSELVYVNSVCTVLY
jgi:hypothetical protein